MRLKRDINTLNKLMIFLEVAKQGQIKNTAFVNGYKQSNISKAIKELEEEIGITLFTRHQNGVSLTNDGKEVFIIACEVSTALHSVRALTNQSKDTQGEIRLWAGDGIVSGYIINYLADFFEKYPNISLDITCSIAPPQLIQETDVAVVYEKPTHKDVEVVLENNMDFGLFASKEYISKYGTPKNLSDLLQNHKICTRANFAFLWKDWAKNLEKAKNVCMTTQSSSTLMNATKTGVGISLHPLSIGLNDASLIHLSKLNIQYQLKYWLVSHKKSKDLPKIKALLDYFQGLS